MFLVVITFLKNKRYITPMVAVQEHTVAQRITITFKYCMLLKF